MLLVKKMPFFHYLFSLKISLEARFNNVLDRKETCFDYIKKNFQRLKKRIFPRGLTRAFGQEMELCFYYLFSSSIRVEIRFNNVLQSPKKSLFPKWVTHALSQKMQNFFFILIWSK